MAPLASTHRVPVSTLPPRPGAAAKACPVCRLMCLRCKCPHVGSLAVGVPVSSVPVVTLHLSHVDAAPGAAWTSPYSQFFTFFFFTRPAHLGTLRWDAVLPPANPLRLTRAFTRASDRQICHLVTVTPRDGLPAHVPLTPGHLKFGQSTPQTALKEPYWHQA